MKGHVDFTWIDEMSPFGDDEWALLRDMRRHRVPIAPVTYESPDGYLLRTLDRAQAANAETERKLTEHALNAIYWTALFTISQMEKEAFRKIDDILFPQPMIYGFDFGFPDSAVLVRDPRDRVWFGVREEEWR